MEHKTFSQSHGLNHSIFQGLIQNEGRSFTNWGLHRSTTPAVFAEPISYADVQAVVRDSARFPGRVNPVGSMLSVASTLVTRQRDPCKGRATLH